MRRDKLSAFECCELGGAAAPPDPADLFRTFTGDIARGGQHPTLMRIGTAWGRTLNKSLKSYGLPTDFGQWSILAADRKVWQQRIGIWASCPCPATTLIHDKWRELFDGHT